MSHSAGRRMAQGPPLVSKRPRADTQHRGFPGTAAEQLQSLLTPARPTLIRKRRHTRVQPADAHGASPPPHPGAHSHAQPPRPRPWAPLPGETKPSPFATQPAGHRAQVHTHPNPQVHPFPHALPAPSSTGTVPTSSHTLSQLFQGDPGRLLSGAGGEQSRRCQKRGACQGEELYPYACDRRTKSSCPSSAPGRGAARRPGAPLIELGRSGPATRAPPAAAPPPAPGAAGAGRAPRDGWRDRGTAA